MDNKIELIGSYAQIRRDAKYSDNSINIAAINCHDRKKKAIAFMTISTRKLTGSKKSYINYDPTGEMYISIRNRVLT